MRKGLGRTVMLGAIVALVFSAGMPPASAIHWYRGTSGGCSSADGELTDAPDAGPTVTATVVLGHNAFATGISGFDPFALAAPAETKIKVGEAIRWTWNSAHCHSVTSEAFVEPEVRAFDSGFHYPTVPPESQQVVPGFLEYPTLDETPTLSYVRTFDTAGTFPYFCVHHASIGMRGVVVVEEA